MLRGRFIGIQAYLNKQEKGQINNLTLHLKQLEKEEMRNPKVLHLVEGKEIFLSFLSRRKKILKIRAEINTKETKEITAKVNNSKSWFFKKINKIGKPLARLIKKQRKKTQINKIRNENGEITTANTEIQRIIRDYYQQLYASNSSVSLTSQRHLGSSLTSPVEVEGNECFPPQPKKDLESPS